MPIRVARPSQLASTPEKPGYLPVSIATVWRWAREGRLPPPFKLSPGTTVFDLDQVDAFIAKQAGTAVKADGAAT